jgi:hypothetical protein
MSTELELTRHGGKRAKTRGFPHTLIHLIREHGRWVGGRLVLNRRDMRTCLEQVDEFRRRVVRLLDKGGGTAVFGEDDQLITIFSPRTYRRVR